MTSKLPQMVEPFSQSLKSRGLSLTRLKSTVLQINVGLLCNLACRHCHLEAGPARQEIMSADTVSQVVELSKRFSFGVIDVTGGAPEMNPHILDLLGGLSGRGARVMLRSNLTAMDGPGREQLIDLCLDKKVVIVASFPALNETQAESQRGKGIFLKSIEVLQRLNGLGYGKTGSGLELNLVSNPAGAFIPNNQSQLEDRFRQILMNKWGIEFNQLFSFANVPLGRFKKWLVASGNYVSYMEKLAHSQNPCALDGVMCRSLISVGWDGYLYDCDFNQAIGLGLGGQQIHISELEELPVPGLEIAVSDHCYACTAGSGFT
nr:arsenosugar biosynthesis radical SAM protein ArsS [Desulfobulbaceae bacterium]